MTNLISPNIIDIKFKNNSNKITMNNIAIGINTLTDISLT